VYPVGSAVWRRRSSVCIEMSDDGVHWGQVDCTGRLLMN